MKHKKDVEPLLLKVITKLFPRLECLDLDLSDSPFGRDLRTFYKLKNLAPTLQSLTLERFDFEPISNQFLKVME